MTVAELLVQGLRIAPLENPPMDVPQDTPCALSGRLIATGYPVSSIVASETSEMMDTFRNGLSGYVGEAEARAFKSANPRAGNPCAKSTLAFADGACFQPLINRDSAIDQGRPCWSDLVRDLWPARRSQECVVIVTTNTKRRLWPVARVGVLSERTPVLMHDGDTSRVLFIDWPRLLLLLDRIETAYNLGFSKPVLDAGLYRAWPVVQTIGLAATRDLERSLSPLRSCEEWPLALLIAQKKVNP